MHIRGRRTRLNPVNPYSAAAEWAAAAQRAANRAGKLSKSEKGLEDKSSPDEASLLTKWMDALYSQPLTIVEYHTPAVGNDSDFG